MQSGLSSKYAEFNGNLKTNRKARLRALIVGLVGSIIVTADVYYYPSPSVTAPTFLARTLLLSLGGVFWLLAGFLVLRVKSGLTSEQSLFLITYDAASKLNEYVMHSSKEKARKVAQKRLQALARAIGEDWRLNFKLAKETLAPVQTFITDLKDKVLYSVEKGTYDQASSALTFVQQLAWFLLSEHPTLQGIPTAPTGLLERPPRKKSIFGRGVDWIVKRPSSKTIAGYSILGLVAGLLVFEIARTIGVDTNYAWASAIATFLAMLGFSWKKP